MAKLSIFCLYIFFFDLNVLTHSHKQVDVIKCVKISNESIIVDGFSFKGEDPGQICSINSCPCQGDNHHLTGCRVCCCSLYSNGLVKSLEKQLGEEDTEKKKCNQENRILKIVIGVLGFVLGILVLLAVGALIWWFKFRKELREFPGTNSLVGS